MKNTPQSRGITRRGLIGGTIAGSAAAALASNAGAAGIVGAAAVSPGAARHELPKLPWADDALQPYITANTLSFHYGKHHAAYVSKLNASLEGSDAKDMSLKELIVSAAKNEAHKKFFNNAAQAWNHAFYWNSMRPGGGGEPSGKMAEKIAASFGDYSKFKAQFAAAAGGQFGSGWAWLVAGADGKLAIEATANADTPIAHGRKPLVTCDVWEHAYYLDFQNRRPDYVAAFLDHLLNWDFAEKNLG